MASINDDGGGGGRIEPRNTVWPTLRTAGMLSLNISQCSQITADCLARIALINIEQEQCNRRRCPPRLSIVHTSVIHTISHQSLHENLEHRVMKPLP